MPNQDIIRLNFISHRSAYNHYMTEAKMSTSGTIEPCSYKWFRTVWRMSNLVDHIRIRKSVTLGSAFILVPLHTHQEMLCLLFRSLDF
jgi:hypothetical protein